MERQGSQVLGLLGVCAQALAPLPICKLPGRHSSYVFPCPCCLGPRAHLALHFLTQTLTLPCTAALRIHARRLSIRSGAPQGQEPYRTQPTVAAQEMCV